MEEAKDSTQGFMPPGTDTMKTGFNFVQEAHNPPQTIMKAKVQGLGVGAINEYESYPFMLMDLHD